MSDAEVTFLSRYYSADGSVHRRGGFQSRTEAQDYIDQKEGMNGQVFVVTSVDGGEPEVTLVWEAEVAEL